LSLTAKEVVQADQETLQLLKPTMDAGQGNLPKEWNMLPVSYRASSGLTPTRWQTSNLEGDSRFDLQNGR
jgi:hypothetical protein